MSFGLINNAIVFNKGGEKGWLRFGTLVKRYGESVEEGENYQMLLSPHLKSPLIKAKPDQSKGQFYIPVYDIN